MAALVGATTVAVVVGLDMVVPLSDDDGVATSIGLVTIVVVAGVLSSGVMVVVGVVVVASGASTGRPRLSSVIR